MTSGIRTEIQVGMPGECPVATASENTETKINSVTRSTVPTPSGEMTEEFSIEAGAELEQDDVTRSFAADTYDTYRFTHDPTDGCVCHTIEQFDCPVSDIRAKDGQLFLTFYSPEVETIKEIVSELREHFAQVRIRNLSRSGEVSDHELVVLDRSRLTDRQLEVLETAHEMGYFAHPKGANAGDVAEELDISPSTFAEHLAAAQSKVMDSLLDI